MSDFTDQSKLNNQSRLNTASSFEITLESAFSVVQRTEIANIIGTAIKTIQMQQLTSSLTTEAQSINQETEYFKK
jgi:hypothetical protein